jgi:hypothetical protein
MRLRLITSVFRETELGNYVGVAVVAAFIEEEGFLLLREGHPELDHERRDERHKSGFKSGREAARDSPERILERADILAGHCERVPEASDGGAQAQHGADEPEDRDRPDKAVDQPEGRLLLGLVIFRLRLEDVGDVANTADIAKVRESTLDPVEKDEVPRVIDEAVDLRENRLCRLRVEEEGRIIKSRALRCSASFFRFTMRMARHQKVRNMVGYGTGPRRRNMSAMKRVGSKRFKP